VSRGDGKSTIADLIAAGAEHLQPIGWVAGNTAVVLLVLCVSEKHGANNLVACSSTRVGDSGGCQSCTLTVILLALFGNPGSDARWLTYEYPPATTLLLGHLVLAKVRRRTISEMEASGAPRGDKFPARVAP
jgi:hypothetical protein